MTNGRWQRDFQKEKQRAMVLLACLAIMLLLSIVVPVPGADGIANYVPLHITLETIAIVIAVMIFAVGLHSWHRQPEPGIILLSCVFLGVALTDFTHMLSYPGMPDLVTPAGPEKAINFWLAARSMAAVALLLALLPRSDRPLRRRHYFVCLLATLAVTALAHWWFLFHPDSVPDTFDEETGLTPLKIAYEYVLVAAYMLAAVLFRKRFNRQPSWLMLCLFVAAAVMVMSEIFFTLYADATDVFNLLGHVYKIIAYFFLYRALIVTGIEMPYQQVDVLQKRQQATLDALPDMMFEVDADGTVYQYQSGRHDEELLAPPEAFIGQSLQAFLPPAAWDTCRETIRDIERSGRSSGREYSLQFNGDLRWYEISGAGSVAVEDQGPRYLMLVRNITARVAAERALQRNQRILRTTLDNLPIGVAVNTVGSKVEFEYMNNNFPVIYGCTREALEDSDAFWEVVYEDEAFREQIREQVLSDYTSGDPDRMKWENIPISKEGQATRYITAQNVPVPDEGLSISLVEDVTEWRQRENELRIAAAAFQSQDAVLITDETMCILRVNPAFERTLGYREAEVRGKSPGMFGSGQHDEEFFRSMWVSINEQDFWLGEIINRHKNGNLIHQRLSITAVRDDEGKVSNYVGDYIDLSELKEAEETISTLARYDSLTGLPNRQHARELLQDRIAGNRQKNQFSALVMLDINDFKTINETSGTQGGDLLLEKIAQKLQEEVGSAGEIARFGGDVFIVIHKRIESDAEQAITNVQPTVRKLLQAVEDTYNISGRDYYVSASAGVTIFGGEMEIETDELLKQVDIALAMAKSAGPNSVRYFEQRWQETANRRVQLLNDLRAALTDTDQFRLLYQPQVNGKGEIIGAEALLRWQHPEHGLLGAADFIPLAEEMRLMGRLGDWVMETGIDQLSRWKSDSATRHLDISLNVSPQQFYNPNFVEHLLRCVKDADIDTQYLILEITESVLIDKLSEARSRMEAISATGIRFAMDDFGTGYSSLAYISELPLHQLKIDRSFVTRIGDASSRDASIVRAVIDMAHTLGMQVLAEGVETDQQKDYLLRHGCELYQGYLFSEPVPLEEFIEMVKGGGPR